MIYYLFYNIGFIYKICTLKIAKKKKKVGENQKLPGINSLIETVIIFHTEMVNIN